MSISNLSRVLSFLDDPSLIRCLRVNSLIREIADDLIARDRPELMQLRRARAAYAACGGALRSGIALLDAGQSYANRQVSDGIVDLCGGVRKFKKLPTINYFLDTPSTLTRIPRFTQLTGPLMRDSSEGFDYRKPYLIALIVLGEGTSGVLCIERSPGSKSSAFSISIAILGVLPDIGILPDGSMINRLAHYSIMDSMEVFYSYQFLPPSPIMDQLTAENRPMSDRLLNYRVLRELIQSGRTERMRSLRIFRSYPELFARVRLMTQAEFTGLQEAVRRREEAIRAEASRSPEEQRMLLAKAEEEQMLAQTAEGFEAIRESRRAWEEGATPAEEGYPLSETKDIKKD